jgi:hypothetical protein
VVETINFDGRSPGVSGGATMSEKARVVERFTRVDAHTIDYRFTIDDPLTYTKPFTAAVPMTNEGEEVPDQILEYACHEGNRVIFMTLSGARAEEKRAAEKKK